MRAQASHRIPREPGPERDISPQFGDLLEREPERSATLAGLGRSLGGDGAALAFEGPAGIGKTSLLRALSAQAQSRGARVLWARAGEAEHGLAFGLVGQLFTPPFARAIERKRLLAGPARPAAPVLGLAPGPPSAQPAGQALHGLYWLCAKLCERAPLVLAVDDVHWADEASLRFFLHLAHRFAGLRLLLAVAARPAGPEPRRALLDELLHDEAMYVCRPRPLSASASATMVRTRLGARASVAMCDACHSATGGNPFLVAEIARALRDDGIDAATAGAAAVEQIGPRTVARSVLVRLSRLSADAVALARAVAIFPDGADFRHAAALADLDEAAAARAADRLAELDVLASARPLTFLHPVLRTAVYQDLPAANRALLHLRAARLLRAEDRDPAKIAMHLLATEPGTDPAAFGDLHAAARAALAARSAQMALRFIERALEEPVGASDRASALHMRGIAGMLAGSPTTLEDLRAAVADTPGTDAALLRDLAGALASASKPAEAVAALDEAAGATSGRDAELFARCVIDRLWVLWSHDETIDRYLAEMRGVRAAETPQSLLDDALLAHDSACEVWRCEDADRATTHARRSLGAGRLVGAGADALRPLSLAALALALADRPGEGLAAMRAALEIPPPAGAEMALMYGHLMRASIRIYAGDLADAEGDLRLARDHAGRQLGDAGGGAAIVSMLAVVALERCGPAAAQELLAGLTVEPTWAGLHVLAARGRVALAAGRSDEALEHLGAAVRCAERRGLRHPLYPIAWRGDLALAAAAVGDDRRAREQAEQDLARARRFGAAGAVGSALRVAGLVAGGEQGLVLLSEAAATLASSSARLLYAETLADLGAALRRANRRAAARGPLHLAADVARRCGSERLVRRATEEHLASGGRPRRTFATGVESLTPSETRVARLAATGFTNREIAQQLYVTIKTVEMHVGNALGKLGISSRRQLGDVAGLIADEATAA